MDSDKQRYNKRLEALKTERSSWLEHWRDIGQFIAPRKFRYLVSDTNRGWKKNQFIINNTATLALRTLTAGMMSGYTSPARPWLKLVPADEELADFGAVRQWLDLTEQALFRAFAQSNIYNALHNVYAYLACFGTAVLHVDDDFKDGIRGYVFPIGQYVLANSPRLQVDTCMREFRMTVVQLVQQFGLEKCSAAVQKQYQEGNYESPIDCVHILQPNLEAEPGKYGQKQFPYKSCWFEKSEGLESDKFLRESGYQEFPAMAPRWVVTGEDVYGECPGMDALGDVKALQQLERRKAQALDKIVNPPMQVPSALQNQGVNMLPGDKIYVDTVAPGQVVKPAIEINPNALQAIELSCREHEGRIKSTFYYDLWLSLTESENADMTAREVAERHEEKMLQLGPVGERLETELYNPLVMRSLSILGRQGRLPPPPPELKGQQLNITYISIMAQAQKMASSTAIQRFVSFVGEIAGVKPDILDKADLDAAVEDMADAIGVKSNMVVPQDKVEAIRQSRAQQAAKAQDVQNAQALAQAGANLAKVDMGSDSALSRVAGTLPAGAAAGLVSQ